VTKIQHRASGPHRGGVPFRRGTLFHLLKNRIYLGEIVHKGAAHPGEHPAIVDRELWDQVQLRLAEHATRRKLGAGANHPSLLVGLVSDGLGRRMSPSHAVKGPKRYRYYVTHPATAGDSPVWRVSAHDLERIVIDGLVAFLADPAAVNAALGDALDAATRQAALQMARATAANITSAISNDLSQLLRTYVAAVELHDDRVEVAIRLDALGEPVDRTHLLVLPATRVRSGHEVKLVIADSSAPPVNLDARLIGLVADAHRIRSQVLAQPDQPMARIAKDLGRCRGDLADQMRLSYLAPDIVAAIIDGSQPASLTRKRLAAVDLPLDWTQQRQLLGFA
jgi:site-specific DNA recombinase